MDVILFFYHLILMACLCFYGKKQQNVNERKCVVCISNFVCLFCLFCFIFNYLQLNSSHLLLSFLITISNTCSIWFLFQISQGLFIQSLFLNQPINGWSMRTSYSLDQIQKQHLQPFLNTYVYFILKKPFGFLLTKFLWKWLGNIRPIYIVACLKWLHKRVCQNCKKKKLQELNPLSPPIDWETVLF